MTTQPTIVAVKVSGEFALFTRPELKVERVSYPFMTPSAARGILDAICFKPQMRWHVRRITALRPNFPADFPPQTAELTYRLMNLRRNEIQDKISPRTVESWINDPSSFEPYFVNSAGRESVQGLNRTQRNTLVLQHVAYCIEASPVLTEKANRPRATSSDDEEPGPDTPAKYAAMLERRVRKGQCFHRPYLGCREFACDFAPPDGAERPLTNWNESLGLMLYDIKFSPTGTHLPGFFHAAVSQGVLHCDTELPGPNHEPPVTVLGWQETAA